MLLLPLSVGPGGPTYPASAIFIFRSLLLVSLNPLTTDGASPAGIASSWGVLASQPHLDLPLGE